MVDTRRTLITKEGEPMVNTPIGMEKFVRVRKYRYSHMGWSQTVLQLCLPAETYLIGIVEWNLP